ncbi:MAG: hypothetical protein ABJF01_26395 [bacterium]
MRAARLIAVLSLLAAPAALHRQCDVTLIQGGTVLPASGAMDLVSPHRRRMSNH